jgi:hypothetical protein
VKQVLRFEDRGLNLVWTSYNPASVVFRSFVNNAKPKCVAFVFRGVKYLSGRTWLGNTELYEPSKLETAKILKSVGLASGLGVPWLLSSGYQAFVVSESVVVYANDFETFHAVSGVGEYLLAAESEILFSSDKELSFRHAERLRVEERSHLPSRVFRGIPWETLRSPDGVFGLFREAVEARDASRFRIALDAAFTFGVSAEAAATLTRSLDSPWHDCRADVARLLSRFPEPRA